MKIKTSRETGFTLVEIMIVIAIIGVLAAMAIPNFLNAGNKAKTRTCIVNLQQIQSANATYILEHSMGAGDPPPSFEQIKPYLGTTTGGALVNVDIKCPAGGEYSQGATAGDKPTCSRASEGHVLP
jgi:prepilin-type N-terminal cleavage/methylation domain-containing protein